MKNPYAFPLCIQLTPPEDILENKDFQETLALLQKLGFYGVELNLFNFSDPTPQKLTSFLAGFDLKLSMIATGVFAKRNGLSLSTPDEAVRQETVRRLGQILDYAAEAGAGVICGFVKGGPDGNRAEWSRQMAASLQDLSRLEQARKAALYLEATNHYEATLVNTVKEGVDFIAPSQGLFQVLPDTYHMNIEECDLHATMVKYRQYYGNIHVSDNNRYFPGLGGIDFLKVLAILRSFGYQGTMAIEGRCLGTLREDIARSADYLHRVSQRVLDVI